MSESTMAAPFSSPRPMPQFYTQDQTFSTKKERKSVSTPRDCLPPRPPVKSCPPVSRIFPWKTILSNHAQVVSFRNVDNPSLSPSYNENSKDSYFEQCFEDPEPIGCGSFGEVFRVRSREDGKLYAVKKSKDRFKGQYDRKRKMEEVAKHETLPSHSNCVQFVKAWEEKGHLYIQTELCRMSLSQFCEVNHNIAESVIWNYMVDLLMAVKHLHDHNLVHMDIKPDNAFISFDDVCKLGDFGLVIDQTKKKEMTEAMEGDPKYLALELLDGNFGKPADIFSLGMFFLELACDLDLPRGGDAWHILRSGKIPDHLLLGRSFDLRNMLTQMLDPKYSTRPTVDQCLAFPCIKPLLKSRMKRFMLKGTIRSLRSSSPSSPNYYRSRATPPKSVDNGSPSAIAITRSVRQNDSFSEDDFGNMIGARAVNPDLNSSDEFLLPRIPAPRRAFTTPAVRRRPASSTNTSSPIKRLLFASEVVSSSGGNSPVTSWSANTTNSSPVWSTQRNNTSGSSSGDIDPPCSQSRPGTPPMSSNILAMDCDLSRPNIEPKNLLGMFEAASDDEEM